MSVWRARGLFDEAVFDTPGEYVSGLCLQRWKRYIAWFSDHKQA